MRGPVRVVKDSQLTFRGAPNDLATTSQTLSNQVMKKRVFEKSKKSQIKEMPRGLAENKWGSEAKLDAALANGQAWKHEELSADFKFSINCHIYRYQECCQLNRKTHTHQHSRKQMD